MLNALTILAAIGPIERFEDAKHLVGYAGLGASVHDSGQTHATGHITKAGRRDLRYAMTEAANIAVLHHPYWKKEFERLEFRLGRSKAIVAIARHLLIAVWHILKKETLDRHAEVNNVAASMLTLAYAIKKRNLPKGVSGRAFARAQLDRLRIGQDLAGRDCWQEETTLAALKHYCCQKRVSGVPNRKFCELLKEIPERFFGLTARIYYSQSDPVI